MEDSNLIFVHPHYGISPDKVANEGKVFPSSVAGLTVQELRLEEETEQDFKESDAFRNNAEFRKSNVPGICETKEEYFEQIGALK